MSENTTVAVATVAEVKLTRGEKLRAKYDSLVTRIQKDTEALNEIAAELNAAAALATVDVGSAVIVKLGRRFSAEKDTTRYENAVVIGIKEEEDGSRLFKVSYGVGFDADVAVVAASAISLPQRAGEGVAA